MGITTHHRFSAAGSAGLLSVLPNGALEVLVDGLLVASIDADTVRELATRSMPYEWRARALVSQINHLIGACLTVWQEEALVVRLETYVRVLAQAVDTNAKSAASEPRPSHA